MNYFAVILMLLLSLTAQAQYRSGLPSIPIPSNLILDGAWFAHLGVTSTPTTYNGANGNASNYVNLGVTQWNDQSGVILGIPSQTNNFYMVGSKATNAPILTNDAYGDPIIFFPPYYNNGGGFYGPFTYLQTTNNQITATAGSNSLFVAVCSGPSCGDYGDAPTGYGKMNIWNWVNNTTTDSGGFCEVPFQANNAVSPIGLQIAGGGKKFQLYPRMNFAVFAWMGTSTNTAGFYNQYYSASGVNYSAGTGLTNIEIGEYTVGTNYVASALRPYAGMVKSFMVFHWTTLANTPTTNQVLAIITSLSQYYGIVTNFSRNVVFFGDSITGNNLCWGGQGFPQCVLNAMPELGVWDMGIGSAQISSNGLGAGPTGMYSNGPTLIDAVFDPYAQNFLVVPAGVNDMEHSFTALSTYQRLTNLPVPITNKWIIYPCTIADAYGLSGLYTPEIYNQYIRTSGPTAFWTNWIDCGSGSPYTTNLNTAYQNWVYFQNDGIHPSNPGLQTMATIIQQAFVWPRTSMFQ